MFAISFDMVISDLKEHYGQPYNNAYFEIKEILKKSGFEWIQGSTYLTESDDLGIKLNTTLPRDCIAW